MDRVVLVVGAVAIAGVVVLFMRGRAGSPPAANTHHLPRQLDRADFSRPDAAWLVAVFTSTTCDTCAGVWARAALLESSEVAVQELEVSRDGAVHDRYRIDAVPTLVLADRDGVVRRAFLGPMTATDLWAAVAEAREPGTVPPACDHGRPEID